MGNLADADLVHATGALERLTENAGLFPPEQTALVGQLLIAFIKDQRPPMDELRDERDRLIKALLRELILDHPGRPLAHYLRSLRRLTGRYHPGNPPPVNSPLSHRLAHKLATTLRQGINLPGDRMLSIIWRGE